MRLSEATSQLGRLVDMMTPGQLRSALKGSLRDEARYMVRAAKDIMRGGPIRRAASLAAGIRGSVMRRTRGYYVSVTPERWGKKKYREAARALSRGKVKRRKGIHTNRSGQQKPVLMWAESGTRVRRSRGRGKVSANRGNMLGRRGYSPGTGIGALKRTEATEMGRSMERVAGALDKHVNRIAKRYGKYT